MEKKKKESFIEKNKKQILVIALALVLLIAGSYAWLTLTKTGEKTNILRAGKLSLILDDTTSNGILLEKAVPMSETKGKTTQEYTFTLQNEGSTALNYTIYLDDVALENTEERMQDSYVRYRLVKNEAETIDLLTNLTDRALDTGVIEATQTNTYTLQVWIDSAADNAVMGTIFNAKLRVTAEQGNKTSETPAGPTYYYAFGTPDTSSTTDFTTLGKNVFARLGADGSHGVCINDGELFCLQTNDYDNSVAALKTHFGESSCTDNGTDYDCESSAFHCFADVGGVYCDNTTNASCFADEDGSFDCREE